MAEETIERSAKVVVLGDVGRSPRMQYHALSLANTGLKVNIIGYLETTPLPEIERNPNITITKMQPLLFDMGPKFLQYLVKAFWQSISLFLTLLMTGKCNYLLCQNPPAIPTLPICRFYCLITRTKFIIDWHNYAYSIMALSLAPNSLLLKVSTQIEKYFGQTSNHNFCVTNAMKDDLLENWNVVATVLYDRPPKIFHPITLEQKHDFFLKISQQYPEFGYFGRDQLNMPSSDVVKTAFTHIVDNKVLYREDRPALLFSSTSWTQDEDFGLLMEALQVYETTFILTKKLPKLVCVITGKGPMKEQYIEKINAKNWQHVKVVTPWLEASEYPTMVASADLGVCLHTSSSGLDLPMKIVDMFGAGLPVLAFKFQCINELVEDGINGYTFNSSDELSKQTVAWFEDFPRNDNQNKIHEKMREHLLKFQKSRWEENWDLRVKKFFEI